MLKRIWKTGALLFAAVTALTAGKAQVASSYIFSQNTGVYTPITGGTVLYSGTFDDDAAAVTIPAFEFDGTIYTDIYVATNGYITFGTTSPGLSTYTPISSTGTYAGAVVPFGRDLNQAASGTPEIRHEQVGNEYIIQWQDVRRYNVTGEQISFQVRLNLVTYEIQIVYGGTITPGSSTTYPQVGLRGLNNTFATNVNNRSVVSTTGDWINSVAGTSNTSTCYFNSTTPSTLPAAGTTFTWTKAPVCTGTPTAGTISGPSLACSGANFTMSLSGNTADLGITYQWQSSPDGVTYTDIAGATSSAYSGNQTAATYYQCIVTCTNSGLTATTPAVYIDMDVPLNCYCTPTYTTGKTDGDLISEVSISGTTLLNNTGTAPVNPAYTYFPPNPPSNTQTADLQAGTTYNINVTYGSYSSQNAAVWIDFNQNGIFETSERVGYTISSSSTAFQTVSFPITLPCNPTPGTYRMRVRDVYGTTGSSIDPCLNYFYGETEDYDVNILPPPPCPAPTGLAVSNFTADGADFTWTIGCAEIEWVLEYGPVGFSAGTGTLVTGITAFPYTLTGLASSTTYDVYVYADCDINGNSTASGPVQFTTLQAPCSGTPSSGTFTGNSTACAGSNFILDLTGTTNDLDITYQWQSSPDGVTYTDIVGATSYPFTTTQTADTWYQCVVTCTNSGLSSTSTPVLVTMDIPTNCYCIPDYTTGKTDGDLISEVSISGTTLLNNTGTTPVNPAYIYFPPNPPTNTQTADLQAGTTYNINVTYGSFSTQNSAVWIDFNQDGVFDASERVGYSTAASSTGFETVTFPISLPCNPTPGTYRMRVRDVYSTAGNMIDPCATYSYGETEDYDVNILPPPPCPQPSALSAVAGPTSADLSWIAGCTETEWDIEYGPQGFAPGTGTVIAGVTTNPYTLTGLSGSTAYDFYVTAVCGAGNTSSPTGPASFQTTPANDMCADAIALSVVCGTPTVVSASTDGATSTDNGPTCNTTASTAPGVWYTVTGTGADITASLCGSTYDTKLFVYDGTCGALNCIDGDDDYCGSSSQVTFTSTAGVIYYILVTGFGSDFGDFTLTLTAEPAQLSSVATDVTCYGGNDGALDVTVTGGVAPYTFAWDNSATTEDITGLSAGTYNITVTDAIGCVSTLAATVLDGSQITVNLDAVTDATGCFTGDGTISTSASGGTGVYTYLWNSGQATDDITALNAGNYLLTVTDGNGCTGTLAVLVSSPDQPVIAVDAITNTLCNGSSDGAIDISVTGGTPTYNYNWNSGETTEDISGIAAGTYTVTVTDAAGCTVSEDIDVTEPSAILISGVATDTDCSGSANGTIDATVTGGTVATDYNYTWTDGAGYTATTQDISSIPAGAYSLTATDDNGCFATQIVTVGEPAAITFTDVITHLLCNGDTDGEIDITAAGGTVASGYSYTWSDGGSFSATTEDITALTAGTYTVIATDDNGCTGTASFTVNEPAALSIGFSVTDEMTGNDGAIDLTVTGGTPVYTYLWNNSATTEDLSGLTAGTFSVTVTDASGCVASGSATVSSHVNVAAMQLNNLKLYPNPVRNVLFIESGASLQNIVVYDAAGRMVITLQPLTANTQVDFSVMERGIYHIEIISGEQRTIHKVIVQ